MWKGMITAGVVGTESGVGVWSRVNGTVGGRVVGECRSSQRKGGDLGG